MKLFNKINIFKLTFYIYSILFATIALLGIRDLRIEFLGATWPLFCVFSVFILGFYILTLKKKRVLLIDSKTLLFIFIYTLFILFQLFNSFTNNSNISAIVEVFKSLVALIVFILVYFIIKKTISENYDYFHKLFKPAIIISTIILCIYIYRYYIVFNSSFLGINYSLRTETGKNQLAFYLGVFIPVVASNFWKQKSVFNGIYLLIHILAILYVDSKGVLFSLFIAYLFVYIKIPKGLLNKTIKKIFYVSFLIGIIISLFYLFINLNEIIIKLDELNLSNDFKTQGSTQMRLILAVKSLFFFINNPLFGIGTMEFLNKVGTLTHNSYLQIISEQGIIGFTLFSVCLYLLYKAITELLIVKDTFVKSIAISALVGMIYLFFINAYNIMIIYIFWAILFALKNYYFYHESQKE